MPKRQWVIAKFSLLILIAGIWLFIGCSSDDPAEVQPVEFNNTLVIHTDPDFLSIPWSLALPNGSTIAGNGDEVMENMQAGDYTLSWVPQEGWASPRPNPLTRELGSNYQIDFVGYYFLKPGSLFINAEPTTINAGWVLTGPDDSEFAGSGDTTIPNLAPGEYTLYWDDLEGWNSPGDTLTYTLTIFGIVAQGVYELPMESISINPEPNTIEASWTLNSVLGLNQTGTGDMALADGWPDSVDETVANVAYTLIWGDVEGWVTPDSETLDLGRGKNLQFSGYYNPQTGSVAIDAEPAGVNASWIMIGPNGISRSGIGDTDLTDLAPGDYSLTWGDVPGWKTPATETQTISSTLDVTFSGTYEPSLVLSPQPEGFGAPWEIEGAGEFSTSGTGLTVFNDLDAGSYTVTWLEVSGWTTPAAETVSFGSQGLIVSGEYIQNAQTMFVCPEPQNLGAPWRLSGPGGFSESGVGQATVTTTVLGTYTLVWEDLEGWSAPDKVSLPLTDSGNLTFSSTYLRAANFAAIPVDADDDGEFDEFDMGSYYGECSFMDEELHPVNLTNAFHMQTTEVTNGQFAEVMQWAVDNGHAVVVDGRVYDTLDGSSMLLLNLEEPELQITYEDGVFVADLPDHPIVEVNWYGAVAYCDWLSLHKGLRRSYDHSNWLCNNYDPYTSSGYRLPTEAEWEYASRAGWATAYADSIDLDFFVITLPSGTRECIYEISEPDEFEGMCWYSGNSGSETHQVATTRPNRWGLFDMHGNVQEWCNDIYRSTYCGVVCPETNPVGPSLGDTRVQRGGHFFSPFELCRSGARGDMAPASTSNISGFRVVITD